MKINYSIFYLSMIFGTFLMAVMFSFINLGFLTLEFFTNLWFLIMIFMLSVNYTRERICSKLGDDE